MAKTKDENKVITPEFRVSFANVFEATSFEDGDPTFGLTMLFDADADLKAMKELAKRAAVDKWGDKIPKDLKSPFRDGAEKPDVDGYEGKIFVNAKSRQKPGVVDQRVRPILDASEFYSGCYAIASVRAYAYEKKGNRGVAFGLINVQKVRDGEPFGGGRSKAEDDFRPVEGQAGSDDEVGDLF